MAGETPTSVDSWITRIGVMTRRPDLTIEQFQTHWRVRHREVVLQTRPGMRRYVQNHAVLREGYPVLPHPGFDACVETTFGDLGEIDAVYARREELVAIVEDEAKFTDRSSLASMMGHKVLTHPGPESPEAFKLMTFRRAHPTRSAKELLARVEEAHALVAGRLDLVRSEYVPADAQLHEGRAVPIFDVMDALWCPSMEAVDEVLHGPLAGELADLFDGHSLGTERLIVKAIIVYDET